MNNNEFQKFKLGQDEEILFKEQANPKKIDKQLGRFLLLITVLIFFWYITIQCILDVINISTIGILLTMIILTIASMYGLVNNFLLIGYRKNEKYFITNKRIIIINKDKTIEKNIYDIEYIHISNEKNGYGNLTFAFYSNNLYNSIKNSIELVGIKNVRTVVEIIVNLNNDICVTDDKPTGIFSK